MSEKTELLFYEDQYAREFQASVLEVSGHAVALDRTLFYPGGGGQPPDSGVIWWEGTAFPVLRARRDGGLVWHELDHEAGTSGQTGTSPCLPSVGDQVRGEIDWKRRYDLMRTHTALHVLCGVVWRDYGASVTGGNMEPLRGRMDFEFETMKQELVREIEAAINEEVAKGLPVRTQTLPREKAFAIPDLIRTKVNLLPPAIEEVRVVEIVGLDLQADGGTHVADTSEIGSLRITGYKSKGRINKRIELAVEDARS
ncbi:MAG: alanyl-tRNA editing protein AlaXM [Thermoleophilia bacterium]